MNITKFQKIVSQFYPEIVLSNNAEINIFEMTREYYLDVFKLRYESSLERNIKILGLKETLENFERSNALKIKSTSIESQNYSLIMYSIPDFSEIYGVVNFSIKKTI